MEYISRIGEGMKELMDKKGKSRNKKRAAHKICIHLRLQGCNLSMDRFLQALAQFIYKAPKWTLNIVGEALLSAQERSSSVLLCRLMFGPFFYFIFEKLGFHDPFNHMRWLVYVNREIFRQVDTQVLLYLFIYYGYKIMLFV